jgi:putative sterol carrier protein
LQEIETRGSVSEEIDMSDAIAAAVAALNDRLGGGIDGSIKMVIEDEGTVLIDAAGARAADGEADCTMTASADTFKALLDGDLDPTGAFMGGRLAVEGDLGLAMKLASLLG